MEAELESLIKEKEQLEAMKRSVFEADKAFNKRFEEFMVKNLGFKKNDTFDALELIKRVNTKRSFLV